MMKFHVVDQNGDMTRCGWFDRIDLKGKVELITADNIEIAINDATEMLMYLESFITQGCEIHPGFSCKKEDNNDL